MTGFLLSALRVALLAYAGLCLLVCLAQSRSVYAPSRAVERNPGQAGLAFEDVSLTAADGETILAWFVPAAGESDGTALSVLFCHGNAGNRGDRIAALGVLHSLGYNVLLFDYRGYGGSSGRPTEDGTYLDARAGWDYLTQERGTDPAQIVIFGRSLGGAVAAGLAENVSPRALVLDSSFTSAADMAAVMFPFLPARLLCRFSYDSLARMERIGCPLLVAHGRNDRTVPFSQGRRLYEAAAEPKRFVPTGGSHNDGGLEDNLEYQQILARFLKDPSAGQ